MADAQALAAAVGAGMYARDPATQALGIALDAIAPGAAVCRMIVRDDMVQGHATCHGGLIFTLADSAFAYACNSRNEVTVAQQASIAFLAPAREGDVLIAEAREDALAGRNGVYSVIVRTEDQRAIAHFHGLSRTVGGAVLSTQEQP